MWAVRALIRALRWPLAAGATVVLSTGIYWYWRIHRFDELLRNVAREYGADPNLLRAVIWRESRFNPMAIGRRGEIGLMQITPGAAADWAAAEGRPVPAIPELFLPSVNVRAGTWYLQRAVERWTPRADDPLPFALAEYNAGLTRAERWAASAATASQFWHRIEFPSTRRYIAAVLRHYRGTVIVSPPSDRARASSR
ncbi:MAG: lytic transglycosylase domain-containing protein [Kiritimatiellae bacterium]|nr:lytic transglycosylase domain-containing protein [Kiritimatiellia bacterium]